MSSSGTDRPTPDALDVVLSWAVAEWEAGRDRGRDAAEVDEVSRSFDDWFVLEEREQRLVHDHDWGNVEFVDVVLEGLWELVARHEDPVWSTEALHHVADLIVTRLPRLRRHAAEWAHGTAVAERWHGERVGLEALLLAGFPGTVSLSGRLGRHRFETE
jgi:hypothetical protein